ncbi:site-2 protease family protein [Mucisphaera sp.]|uniref:site-2 protease family protein n=1 Tax=Mucisphaera sp. TaxID=2913024 RepID=UPI003D0EC650
MLENAYIAVALFILGFGFLIFIHELGHFLAAKWVGIKCTQFAIGFGTALCSWRKGMGLRIGSTEATYTKRLIDELDKEDNTATPKDKYEERLLTAGDERIDAIGQRLGLGETEYRLNYLPLGGYVKMVGQEDLDPSAMSKSPRSFNSKSVPARALVISAGVIMNLITGFVVFIPAFLAGVDFPAAEVGTVRPDSPAANAQPLNAPDNTPIGLQLGDRILTIDDKPVRDMVDVGISIALAPADSQRQITVDRPNIDTPITYTVTPMPDARREGLLSIGIGPSVTLDISAVSDDSLAASAGVTAGMTLSHVGNIPVTRFYQYREAINATNGQRTTITFTAEDGSARDITVQPTPTFGSIETESGLLGWHPPVVVAEVVDNSPAQAAGIQSGDTITRLGSARWPSFEKLVDTISASGGSALRLAVLRDGQEQDLGNITPEDGRIGVIRNMQDSAAFVATASVTSPEPIYQITPGGRILTINSTPVQTWADVQRALQSNTTNSLSFTYHPTPDSTPVRQSITLNPNQIENIANAGWRAPLLGVAFTELQTSLKANSVPEAISLGMSKTGEFMAQTYLTLLRLFQGSVQVQNLRGPVGIVDEGQKVAARGWPYLLFFLGLISINLAVLNFLPLPIVDGGLMVFLMIEAIRGEPASIRIQQIASLIGIALLGCLFLFVTFNDLWRLLA